MSDFNDLPLENGDLKLETFERDLECEHREVLEDSSLKPCSQKAEYAVTTADFGEPSRVRYCPTHVWNSVRQWMERND